MGGRQFLNPYLYSSNSMLWYHYGHFNGLAFFLRLFFTSKANNAIVTNSLPKLREWNTWHCFSEIYLCRALCNLGEFYEMNCFRKLNFRNLRKICMNKYKLKWIDFFFFFELRGQPNYLFTQIIVVERSHP